MKMSVFFKVCCCSALLLLGASQVSAKTASMGLQVGEVIAAELSTAQVEIFSKNQYPYTMNFASPRYVIIVLKMTPGRSLNPVDYDLVVKGKTYKCVALADDTVGSFDCGANTMSAADSKQIFRLLYIIDGKTVPGNSGTVPAVLKCNFGNSVVNKAGRLASVTFNISNIGSSNFTVSSRIPSDGLLK